MYSRKKSFFYGFLLAIISLSGSVFAQEKERNYEFCSNNNWSNGDKVSANDLRESNVAPTSLLTVDGKKNGGIKVVGENRSDVLIRACVQAWAKSENEAQNLVKSIRIETGSVIQASGATDENWSVSYQILVPRATNLKLTAYNGGISIESVNGNLEFETKNGGLKIDNVGGSVKGRTQNGGVKVNLSGTAFNGSGLDVETQNGGVKLSLPSNYAANIETGTVNGGFSSDFAELQTEKSDKENRWQRNKKVTASINGGGAPIRVITTNGGVKINSN
jgi:hypothetical protein